MNGDGHFGDSKYRLCVLDLQQVELEIEKQNILSVWGKMQTDCLGVPRAEKDYFISTYSVFKSNSGYVYNTLKKASIFAPSSAQSLFCCTGKRQLCIKISLGPIMVRHGSNSKIYTDLKQSGVCICSLKKIIGRNIKLNFYSSNKSQIYSWDSPGYESHWFKPEDFNNTSLYT